LNTEEIWSELLEGNRRFCAGTPQARDLVREREAVATSQHPKAMVLACADSRVAPEIIFDQRLGDLFVVRVAGNVADKLAIGSLEYAAEHLSVPLLVVLGHQRCGGVKAAFSGGKTESPNLKAIIKAVRSSATNTNDGEDALREAERQNARHVAENIIDRSELLRRLVEQQQIRVIPAWYSLDSGAVERI